MAQIDARLDALLRRDPRGVYLPLTPEEVSRAERMAHALSHRTRAMLAKLKTT